MGKLLKINYELLPENEEVTQMKGITVMRTCTWPGNKNSLSPKQVEERAKFALMENFLQPLTSLLNQTFSEMTPKTRSPFNEAYSHNLYSAIEGSFPNFTIQYSNVLLSCGRIGIEDSWCTSFDGNLVFRWVSSRTRFERRNDLVYLAGFDPVINHWYFGHGSIQRNAGSAVLDLPEALGKSFHTYLGFISANGKDVSTSVYTGLVTVS
jgi:hypothetical protein